MSNEILELLLVSQQTLQLGVGLILLMLANIMLGSVSSIFDGTFNWKKFLIGIGKSTVVVLSFYLVLIAGNLNSDMVMITFGETPMNLSDAVSFTLIGGLYFYAKQVFDKLIGYVNSKSKPIEILPEDGVELNSYYPEI